MSDIRVSILLPCLNEEMALEKCIQKAFASLKKLQISGEVLVADNGSTDRSREIASQMGARLVDVREKGYGHAITSGVRAASGEYIVMADADNSYDLSQLEDFLNPLLSGADLVLGNRFSGGIQTGSMPFLNRYIGTPILTWLTNLFFDTHIGDSQCGIRAFRKSTFLKWQLKAGGMDFASEMNAKAGIAKSKIVEVPTRYAKAERDRAPHLRPFQDGFRHLILLLRLYANDLRSHPEQALLLVTTMGLWIFGALLFWMSFERNPLLDYNESNSLRISAQTVPDIFSILKFEQNFPPYYLLLHLFGPNLLVLRFLNLMTWVATVFFGQKILSFFIENRLQRLVACCVFATTPYIFFYSYYSRMYGLTNLLLAYQTYLLLKEVSTGQPPARIRRLILCLLLTSLHPLGILAALTVTCLEFQILRPRHIRWSLFAAVANLVCLAMALAPKASDFRNIYFGEGVQYIDKLAIGLSDKGLLFFSNSVYLTVLNPFVQTLFLTVALIIVAEIFFDKLYKDARIFTLIGLALGFILLPSLFPRGIAGHHAAFFIVPLSVLGIVTVHRTLQKRKFLPFAAAAVAAVWVAITWKDLGTLRGLNVRVQIAFGAVALSILVISRFRNSFQKKFIFPLFACAFAFTHFLAASATVRSQIKREEMKFETCEAYRRLEGPENIFFANFEFPSFALECMANPQTAHLILTGAPPSLDTTNIPLTDLLKYQAKQGGHIDSPAKTIEFLNSSPDIQNFIGIYHPTRIVFHFLAFSCRSREMSSITLPGYEFEECWSPSLFVYRKSG